ncbi:uncharacterized protein FA14DRAFT_190216 [Meira miltonrushii]|uniref:Uncharacterized protein n=1 Tax=Meira miltonrushii TaxID=1280837 RepID=A0A316VLA8_9BASI|nr:uncharacterized protein FA14DRAFT_190216 [Meira miltonrushii]PWN36325.1 hypothetical protein FA14DRAFT_190216 [Meira miltonrushii]
MQFSQSLLFVLLTAFSFSWLALAAQNSEGLGMNKRLINFGFHNKDNNEITTNNDNVDSNLSITNGDVEINGHKLNDGVNTIDGKTYTKTKGFVIGPSITNGPGFQLSPQVTNAFGCMKAGNNVAMGDCKDVQSKIDKALASVTGAGKPTPTPKDSKDKAKSDSSSTTTHTSSPFLSGFDNIFASHKDAAVSAKGHNAEWSIALALSVAGVLAIVF